MSAEASITRASCHPAPLCRPAVLEVGCLASTGPLGEPGPAESDQAGGMMGACRAGDSGVTPGVSIIAEVLVLIVGCYHDHARLTWGDSESRLRVASPHEEGACNLQQAA